METIISKRYADGGIYVTKEIFIPGDVVDSQLADAKNLQDQAIKAQTIIDELTADKIQIIATVQTTITEEDQIKSGILSPIDGKMLN